MCWTSYCSTWKFGQWLYSMKSQVSFRVSYSEFVGESEQSTQIRNTKRTLTRLQLSLKPWLCPALASFLPRTKMMSSKEVRRYLMGKAFAKLLRFYPLIFAPGNRKKKVLLNLCQALSVITRIDGQRRHCSSSVSPDAFNSQLHSVWDQRTQSWMDGST